jgi:predicted RNase H-like HicB family nuclease
MPSLRDQGGACFLVRVIIFIIFFVKVNDRKECLYNLGAHQLITGGDTIEEVMANLKDAIEGSLEVANSRNAIESTDQIVEIAV